MIRSPFLSELYSLRDTLDQFANQTFSGRQHEHANGSTIAMPMPIDVFATDDHAVIVAAVPGMRPEDLDLTIHQDTVTMSGSIRSVAETEDAKHATRYISELGSGTYRRSISLPFPVDADRSEATFENGILRSELPKAETAKPKKISINASKPHEMVEATSSGSTKSAESNGSKNAEKNAHADVAK